jgi:acetyl-CoA decarbonylase/synthase, CODH/ACS complex subunit delta
MLPECNGVMIVNREYTGQTPVGMKFSTLASTTGGGQQTPGFIGIGKAYLASRKFIAAEGGHRRIVWMPSDLKQELREDFEAIGKRLGMDNFLDLIADETTGIDTASVRAHMEKVNHPALTMWDVTQASPEAAAIDAQRGTAIDAQRATAVEAPPVPAPAQPVAPVAAPAPPVAVPVNGSKTVAPALKPCPPPEAPPSGDGIGSIITVLERLRTAPIRMEVQPDMTPHQQMAALQASTALHLLHAGANMLLMYSGALGEAPAAVAMPPAPLADAHGSVTAQLAAIHESVTEPRPAGSGLVEEPERRLTPATIALPTTFSVPAEKSNATIRTVTLGGSGTRTSSVAIGGAAALPFRHFEGNIGHRPVIAMEVFDQEPKGLPGSLREAYGSLLKDPAAMARHCVDKLGAAAISVRLPGTHPDNGDKSPEEAAETVRAVLGAVGVPVIVTGPNHYEKNNAVMKQIAAAFAGENLLLNWVETDNYKTIAAAAMAYGHCVVPQAPIDVNMSKQLNILLMNMGVAPEKIVIDPMTGALGYGLEYTYSVMERIRGAAFTGDTNLAMPMLVNPGFEVARAKESKAPGSAFPLWGPEAERGALLEIATSMALLNAGADLLILYHPTAARIVKRKIEEMCLVAN